MHIMSSVASFGRMSLPMLKGSYLVDHLYGHKWTLWRDDSRAYYSNQFLEPVARMVVMYILDRERLRIMLV